jgi:thiol-disulfide isomerase/thioredoxin
MKTRDPKAFDMLKEFHKQLLDLKRPELARMLEGQILGVELAKSARKIPGSEPLEDMLKKINEYIGDKPDSLGAKLVMRTVSTLSYVDKKEALKFCQKYVKVLAESDDEKIAKNAERLEGIGRRLDLVGHPMKIVGKTLDGEEFNWADYKGKVVLVQFWATWCGPCRGEIPGILKNYENYHDKGFEVVGISLDREFKKLESYIEKESIPWAIIYNGPREEGVERGELPNTTYYGVSGIPEIILVGKDGNVIATGLRGKKITAAIEKIFGPVEEEKPEEGEEGKES